MTLEQQLKERADNKCELTGQTGSLFIYNVPPEVSTQAEYNILVSEKTLAQLEKKEQLDASHWKDLPTNMWSEVSAVQVVAWRILNRLKNESWANEALDILYLDEDSLTWAKKTGDHENEGTVEFHQDSNGSILQEGDNVVLTKTLDVKGSSLKASLGTVVKNIRLVADNIEQIEGKIEGQTIVILTKYLRKQ